MNRLAAATSPYLLQHAENPVDWWPWCEDAFAAARERDVPVLLSVGYAACHWCHVMAYESFENADIARFMNEHFVCVKVDREERPDVDAVYMEATQAMTGHGGWPMTCFLTPEAEPFFCGTYFPPQDRGGMPSFLRVCASVTQAWTERRDEIRESAGDVVRQLQEMSAPPTSAALTADMLDAAAKRLSEEHDDEWGGFGNAPKFPPSMVLEFLLRHWARTGDARSLDMVSTTCERMARGGIYDQLAGGFARYSVDGHWVVPHFEKMLYDNALLARVYAHWWRATVAPLARRIAIETCEWMLAELRTSEGGFASALDADSEGEEGKFYVWAPGEVGAAAAQMFTVTESGTFEHGRSVLQLLADPDPAEHAVERARLLELRAHRVRPARDDKVVAAWNGLAIAALADCGVLFDRTDFVETAKTCATLLADVHVVPVSGGVRLRRVSRDGVVGDPAGVLEDYGDVAEGLLSLHQATGERRWLDLAGQLLAVTERFADERGGFFDTADDAEQLVRRPQDPTDNATPSGLAAIAGALLTYAALTGDRESRELASRAVDTVTPVIERFPRFAGWAAAIGEALAAGPLEIVVVDRSDLARIARLSTSAGAVVVAAGESPLLADRPSGAAYVCQGFVCDAPTTDPDQLAQRVGARSPSAKETGP